LWDGPASAAVATFEFAKARLTGEEPKLGENPKATVEMSARGSAALETPLSAASPLEKRVASWGYLESF
jgi:hypothetical protein